MSENFSDQNAHLTLFLHFSHQEKPKQSPKKHIIYSRKDKFTRLKVQGDNLDTSVVAVLYSLALEKSYHFHVVVANVF